MTSSKSQANHNRVTNPHTLISALYTTSQSALQKTGVTVSAESPNPFPLPIQHWGLIIIDLSQYTFLLSFLFFQPPIGLRIVTSPGIQYSLNSTRHGGHHWEHLCACVWHAELRTLPWARLRPQEQGGRKCMLFLSNIRMWQHIMQHHKTKLWIKENSDFFNKIVKKKRVQR
jgi:hypothetical protein